MKISDLFEDLILYHKTAGDFDRFEPYSHFGTAPQAEMRGVAGPANTRRVSVSGTKWKRMKDTGSWDRKVLRRLELQEYDGVVYLNRYEGIPLPEFEKAWAKYGYDLDRLSDGQFKKACPSAADSYIVFDPYRIKPMPVIREWDEEFEEEEQWEPEVYIMPKGTIVYHGTSTTFPDREGLTAPAWVSMERDVAVNFVTWHEPSKKKPRILVFRTNVDLRLAQINGRDDMGRLAELVQHGDDTIYSTVEFAEEFTNVAGRYGWHGWIVPDNYGPGDDTLLCRTDVLTYLRTERV